jgi:hypothetical protein
MAETVIAVQEVAGPYVSESETQITAVTWTAMDPTNGNKIVMTTRRVLLLFRNDNVAAQWVTIEGSNDPYGRDTTISQLDIGIAGYGAKIIEPVGWEQTLGGRDLSLISESADVFVLAIPL